MNWNVWIGRYWPVPTSRIRLLWIFRLTQAGIFLSLVWKLGAYQLVHFYYQLFSIYDPFFPDWLRSNDVLFWSYTTSVVACGLSIALAGFKLFRRFLAMATWIGISVLCVHQGSFNDVTFLTCWWTGIWTNWFAWRLDDPDHDLTLKRGIFLSKAIVSMIFFGAAVGKWTPEYWSGQVLYDIYFEHRKFWLFDLVRDHFDVDQVRTIAIYYSRMVVLVESACGPLIWMVSHRKAAIISFSVFFSIAIFSNFKLFSVMMCLMTLSLVGLFQASSDRTSGKRQMIVD